MMAAGMRAARRRDGIVPKSSESSWYRRNEVPSREGALCTHMLLYNSSSHQGQRASTASVLPC